MVFVCSLLIALCPLVNALTTAEAEVYGHIYRRSPELVTCLTSKNVPVKLTTDSDFSTYAKPYNLRLAYTPAAIALPTTNQHVQDSLICAGQTSTKAQPKSGGHSYASYSSGGIDGVLIIDLESFQSISVDTSTNIAAVGGGVRIGNMALGLYNQAKRGLPAATCAGVGVGGSMMHGGYGYTSRNWGLGLDTIKALDVVLPNGTFLNCDRYKNGDIYYALRGAAHSIGVVTKIYFQTQKAPDNIINFSFNIPDFLSSPEAAARNFLHLQDFAQNASVVNDNLSFGMYMDASGLSISGQYFGLLSTFTNKIQPELLRTLPIPRSSNVKKYAWLDALENLAGGPLQQPLTGYDSHDTFFVKSIVTQEAHPLTLKAMTSFFTFILTKGKNLPFGWFVIINLYGGPGSAINKRAVNFSGYSHRSSLWVFQNYGFSSNNLPPFSNDVITYITDLTASVTQAQPDGQFEAYLNYVDPTLTPAQAHELYYGAETYAKLLAVKQRVDPGKGESSLPSSAFIGIRYPVSMTRKLIMRLKISALESSSYWKLAVKPGGITVN
ncbi:MAG: hypothetical protein M1814_006269 [Vezdaea aestivalis]|nr:MAG: hypothetical protein M1814_006269 [Vezdaea aestivalis]